MKTSWKMSGNKTFKQVKKQESKRRVTVQSLEPAAVKAEETDASSDSGFKHWHLLSFLNSLHPLLYVFDLMSVKLRITWFKDLSHSNTDLWRRNSQVELMDSLRIAAANEVMSATWFLLCHFDCISGFSNPMNLSSSVTSCFFYVCSIVSC